MEAREQPALGLEEAARVVQAVADNVGRVVHAPDETLRLCVLCLVSEGHLIIEDFPGVGKTMLAKAMARSVDSSFSRMQFTPHLLPSDVNCMRENDESTERAIALASIVFPTPGKASIIRRPSPTRQRKKRPIDW